MIKLCVIGVEMTFKDDLESLGYLIVMMMTGNLPWRDIIMSGAGAGGVGSAISILGGVVGKSQ